LLRHPFSSITCTLELSKKETHTSWPCLLYMWHTIFSTSRWWVIARTHGWNNRTPGCGTQGGWIGVWGCRHCIEGRRIGSVSVTCFLPHLTPKGRGIHILDDEWIQTCPMDRRTRCFHSSKFVWILTLVLKDLFCVDFQNFSLHIFYCSKGASMFHFKNWLF
jgi:hypothetical protein